MLLKSLGSIERLEILLGLYRLESNPCSPDLLREVRKKSHSEIYP